MTYIIMLDQNLIDIFKLKEIQTFIQIGSSLEYGDLKSPQEEKENVILKLVWIIKIKSVKIFRKN